jgi:hypothetical protein
MSTWSNYFFNLPVELQTMIYEYDSTYVEYFGKVLDEVSPIRLFQFLSGEFMVVNLKSNLYWKCDCLDNPTWIGVYRYKNLDFLTELCEKNDVIRISNKSRQFLESHFLYT